jgi:hypothetical protein
MDREPGREWASGGRGHVPDMVAVTEDAYLVDQLSRRAGVDDVRAVFADDRVAQLLVSLVADVDDDLPLADNHSLATTMPGGRPWEAAGTALPKERRRPLALVTAAAVAGAVLLSSGAAAAVTGSPLTPWRAAVHAVWSPEQGATLAEPRSLPSQAADPAQVNQRLSGVGAALAQGRLDDARDQLAAARALVDAGADLPPGQEQRLQNLETRLQSLLDGKPGKGGGQGPSAGTGKATGNGTGNGTGKATGKATGNGTGKAAGKGSSEGPATGSGTQPKGSHGGASASSGTGRATGKASSADTPKRGGHDSTPTGTTSTGSGAHGSGHHGGKATSRG